MLKTSSNSPDTGKSTDPENGYLLIGVLFLVAVVLITLAVAAPRVASEIQRDKELELYHRGLQYQHAIRLYYKKFGRYPSNLEQLEKTNEIRFLRKRYKDPVTGKDEWRMIHFGEQKVKTTGLFGQPIAATGTNGLSTPGTPPNGPGGSAFGGSSSSAFGSGSGSAFGSGSGSSAFGSGSGSSAFGSSGGSTSAFGGSTGAAGSPAGTGTAATGTDTSAAGAAGTQAGATDPGAAGGTNTGLAGASTSGISSIGTGQTFGGGGIVGVSSSSQKASIREYKKQKHYNEWEFVYDPASEMNGMAGGAAGAGQQPGNTNQNGAFGSGGFGSNGSNSSSGGFGSSSSPTGTSTQPTPPTQPTTPAPQQ
jgi:type II secretory pathway pseudopilin PulG